MCRAGSYPRPHSRPVLAENAALFLTSGVIAAVGSALLLGAWGLRRREQGMPEPASGGAVYQPAAPRLLLLGGSTVVVSPVLLVMLLVIRAVVT